MLRFIPNTTGEAPNDGGFTGRMDCFAAARNKVVTKRRIVIARSRGDEAIHTMLRFIPNVTVKAPSDDGFTVRMDCFAAARNDGGWGCHHTERRAASLRA